MDCRVGAARSPDRRGSNAHGGKKRPHGREDFFFGTHADRCIMAEAFSSGPHYICTHTVLAQIKAAAAGLYHHARRYSSQANRRTTLAAHQQQAA
ncbi:hypothetical protein GUJ93_ZPchr0015g6698 [Zizania palustris]|uniref:Uncharacterized protein n=1 Tax=Zizania palustris TaxID=103762 RepID=A0A8J5VVE5_ZIZPA|nr:hypothetical protein GUJ93_ZPchr0015g6698 [Zizania palustris]